MLQVTLDPSALLPVSKTQKTPCEIVTSISGLSWKKGENFPVNWTKEEAKQSLYPWYWDRPGKLRVYWITREGAGYESVGWTDLDMRMPPQDALIRYDADGKKMRAYYESILDRKIFPEASAALISKDDVEMEIDVLEKQEMKVTDDAPAAGRPTDFYNSAISQFAQKLAPLNELLGFVFFMSMVPEQPVQAPDNAVGFVAFPYSESSGSRWQSAEGGMPTALHVRNVPAGKLPQLAVAYRAYNGVAMTAYCPVTLLPEPQTDEQPIQLRNHKGAFWGHVHLSVNDVEDQVEAILTAAAPFFDLPGMMWRYLHDNAGKLHPGDPATDDYLLWINKINDFLWAALRDALGFGRLPESDGHSMAERLVRHYCNTKYKNEVHNLSEAEQASYWSDFERIKKDILAESGAKDNYTLDAWKKLVREDIFTTETTLATEEKELEERSVRITDSVQFIVGFVKLDIANSDLANVVEKKVGAWLQAWHRLLDLLRDDDLLVKRILFEQWNRISLNSAGMNLDAVLNIPAGDKARMSRLYAWFDSAFSNAGEIRLFQQEAIAVTHKTTLLKAMEEPNPSEKDIANDILAAIKEYAGARIKKKLFYPFVDTRPFDNPPAVLATPPTWQDFIASIDNNRPAIEVEVNKELQRPLGMVPHLQLRVDKFESINPDKEDLNDEIAGHIVLMQRGDGFNESNFSNNPWRYLNWAKVRTAVRNTPGAPDTVVDLANSYLVPAFIPEPDGGKTAYLRLSNEQLSLAAGHVAFEDEQTAEDPAAEKVPAYMQYLFSHDKDKAYALWYGYYYQFAGFVALNSGVLPQVLRSQSWPAAYNAPADNPNLYGQAYPDTYFHRRRVPVGKPRVAATRIIPGNTATGIETDILPVPGSLLPLAFELPEWKDNRKGYEPIEGCKPDTVITGIEQAHYLLADGSLKDGEYHQNKMTLSLRLPTTSFWNWYAWLGEEASRPIPEQGTLTYAQKALERELRMRDLAAANGQFAGEGHLCDPAVENKFVVSLERLFPATSKKEWGVIFHSGDSQKGINDLVSQLTVECSAAATAMNKDATGTIKDINVRFGDVVRIHIYCLVRRRYFQEGTYEQKFHGWMSGVVDSPLRPTDTELGGYGGYLFTHPVELWFEAATRLQADADTTKRKARLLWDSLSIAASTGKVEARLRKDASNNQDFAYYSRLDVRHQVWNWNGRLDESGQLLTGDARPDPQHTTNDAMRWEAWAFSDRPDFAALVQETNLLAFRVDNCFPKQAEQVVFTDERPGEEKALYYRFAATMHARYESLGPSFAQSIQSSIVVDGVGNPWRRFLRKSTRVKKLPRPSVRFIIPLTRSIKECREAATVSAASLLVVLNDRWFSEAGLAEQLEVGIDILEHGQKKYINAGNDPILTCTSLGPFEKAAHVQGFYLEQHAGENEVAVFTPTGPTGLTFDLAAQTPRLKGCAFVLDLPDVSQVITVPGGAAHTVNKLEPWSLMQVAVRRTLRPALCESTADAKAVNSDWSAKEWVQFLPSVDAFIPYAWRATAAKNGCILLKAAAGGAIAFEPDTSLPSFDPVFEEKMQRFAVITEKVYDIGGQPCERYAGTYRYQPATRTFTPDHHSTGDAPDVGKIKEGYVRLLLVRHYNGKANESVWHRLFGENATQRPDLDAIQHDPSAALPLVSERILFRI